MPNIAASDLPAKPPKLLDQLKRCIRDKYYSPRTEKVYVYWARWFIRFQKIWGQVLPFARSYAETIPRPQHDSGKPA